MKKSYLIAASLVCALMFPTAAHAAGWNSARASWYGGVSEPQPVAWSKSPRTEKLESKGITYFAHKTMKFGTVVEFYYKGRRVRAICVDRGPYIGGRTFDLGSNTAKRLRFSGVGKVKWRVTGRVQTLRLSNASIQRVRRNVLRLQ